MAEMGRPTMAARTNAPMYDLDRSTATGSTTDGPGLSPVEARGCTPASGRMLELFEPAMTRASRSGRVPKQARPFTDAPEPRTGQPLLVAIAAQHVQVSLHLSAP